MSIRMFEGFKFTKLSTPLHNLDPRAKFILTLGLFVVALMFFNIYALLTVLLIQVPLVVLAKSTRRWMKSMKGGAFLAILIFAMNFITGTTFTFSLAMTIRFLALISSFSIFFMTTSPDDLGLALESLKIPYTLCFTFTTAVRLVPTMAIDAQTVVDAQRSRGLELDKGNLLKRVRNYVPVLIPLIVNAIRRSVELAEALESRAFGSTERREPLIALKMKTPDYLTVLVTFVFIAVAVYINLYVRLPTLDIPIRMPPIWSWISW
jgi:energy-coupling factor transport system permease protein